ncbi:MAG TPA: hypothetical protein P5550_03735 [Bacteroidales bacterium]|nr:hypothetical protein [Bacteroidales bacterium]
MVDIQGEYSCVEVELKPGKKVLNRLKQMGIDWEGLGKPKIVYLRLKVFDAEERYRIYDGDLKLLESANFLNTRMIRKVRPTVTENLSRDDKIEAGLAAEDYIKLPSHSVVRAQWPEEKRYSVYVHKLNNDVWKNIRFQRQNDFITPGKDAFYVGQTALDVEERFYVHTDPDHPNHQHCSAIMEKYSKFPNDFMRSLSTQEFDKASGIRCNGLSTFEALRNEELMAAYIRSIGLGAYSK